MSRSSEVFGWVFIVGIGILIAVTIASGGFALPGVLFIAECVALNNNAQLKKKVEAAWDRNTAADCPRSTR